MENFPGIIAKILLGTLLLGLSSSCHSSTASVEANSTPDPVVAPAGTVLRVRLSQALDTERSRPGDRFGGALDSPVAAGGRQILPKGTVVEGHVLDRGRHPGRVMLALALDRCQLNGRSLAISSVPVIKTYTAKRIYMPAETIVGFTLKQSIAE
jgi:hypothetical protein